MFREKYINPFTDFGFKKLFGEELNKDLLMSFLNELLPQHHQIKELSYSSSEFVGSNEFDRKAVFDIYCTSESGEKFIVEMQKARQNYFKDRSVFYASFPIQEQAVKGDDWNFKLSAVYLIGILDFVFEENKHSVEVKHTIQLKNQHGKVFYDKLTFIYLEMPKFNKLENELETTFDKWLFVLKNLPKLESRPAKLQEKVFEKLFKAAEMAKLDRTEIEVYERSLKYYRDLTNVVDTAKVDGFEQGFEQGIEKGIKSAINSKLLTNQQIANIFGVDVEFIKSLGNK
jgi:predicted transposase/invertase (TIGR01784 family)